MTSVDADFLEQVRPSALCNPPTLVNTLELCEAAIRENVPDDFAECGVFAGAQVAVMAHVLMKYGITDRRVHLFDSFQGIPQASERDDETITGCVGVGNGKLVSTGVSACSMEQVRANMNRWGIDPSLLVYHLGWFQETMPAAARQIERLAVLRLDCDLYDSTLVCLSHLYPKLSAGGYCISDDWHLTGARRATMDYLGEAPAVVPIVGGDGPAWWRK